ncbi:MAG: type II toxin-antitoxin system prevent-host-death family antitoxin [Propionibacteriaceae bacterium]|jgi:prevent-host-death family protein|nr:type II toxin-antitoxin system prevent-host-death family antitoxin [Propionibacteriaceae bacterium]
MMTVGIRELRQNPAPAIEETKRGRTVLVTEYGKPVAHITPLPDPPTTSPVERLIADGAMRVPARGTARLTMPLPADDRRPALSETLRQMREDER